jgi:23S rRNA pseudouridine2605 synthase
MNPERPRSLLSLNRDTRNGDSIEERLHKVLANAGLGSRRLLEDRIEAGEVRVNGQVATLGSSVRIGDRIEVDGKAFVTVPAESEEAQVLIYHKPDGEVTTHDDPEGRPTVFEKLPRLKGARWISIGRLDINTTGLLLITTDGELANAMMHPSSEVEREYICRIRGEVGDEMLERLRNGVKLEDGPARFEALAPISLGDGHSWFRVMLREGRNREVRRLWESQGLLVSRLKRIRYGSVELPRHLRRGHHQPLDGEAYRALRHAVGLPEAPKTLTLQPVIGVRRAAKQNEFRPSTRSQRAWSGAQHDEARELRAFDNLREEPTMPGRNKRRRKRGGAGGAAGRGRAGNEALAGAGRGHGPYRPWTPPGEPGRNRGAPGGRRGGPKAGGGRRGGSAPAVPYAFPSDHAYARNDRQPPAPGAGPKPRRRRGRGGRRQPPG